MTKTLIARMKRKQILEEAELVASAHCMIDIVPGSARMSELEQGMYSHTVLVTLVNNDKVVVQFKDNEIDTTKVALANSLLGDIVPLVQAAPTTKAYFAFVSPFIDGTMWSELDSEMSDNKNAHVAGQLGRLIGACSLGIDSTGIVDRYVKMRLNRILAKAKIDDPAMRLKLEGLLQKSELLKKLPLALCHWDINARNILLDNDSNITGLIDWEMADLLPLGMNVWCIRFLAVRTTGGKDLDTPDELKKASCMAKSFWDALIETIPPALPSFKCNLLVSMQIGFVLQAFHPAVEPDEQNLSQFMLRLQWLEDIFEPFCSH